MAQTPVTLSVLITVCLPMWLSCVDSLFPSVGVEEALCSSVVYT